MRSVRESLLLWNSNKYCTFVCMCVHVRVCVCVCARARVYVALLIQHATRMCHIVTSLLAPLAVPYFSTLSHTRHDFRKKNSVHKKCVLIFSTTFI